MKPVGKPDAGNPHVRFDERGWETGRRLASAPAPNLDSTAGEAKWGKDTGDKIAGATGYSSATSPVSSARFSNFVCACRKTRLTVPTGPLRCLPMISSARPRRFSFFGW